jgi:hypothetical protein
VHRFPLNPHIKNRSRAQEKVAAACLELDQPEIALACIAAIANWRRGAAYADYVYHQARRDRRANLRPYLESAIRIAREATQGTAAQGTAAQGTAAQEWRVDRVRAKVARAYLALGDAEAAREVAGRLSDSEVGIVLVAQSEVVDAAAIDTWLETLDARLEGGNFDQLEGVIQACTTLVDRFYEDTERRAALEKRIKTAFATLPVEIRVERTAGLAQVAIDRGDPAHAQALLQEAAAIFAGHRWQPENRVPMRARLAAKWFRAGNAAVARRELRVAVADYAKHGASIVDIYRAGALRPVAEAQQVMGDTAAALATYERAVAAGVRNPNSRPRAEDLAATCCSMAIAGAEPDPELRARLTKICNALADPW